MVLTEQREREQQQKTEVEVIASECEFDVLEIQIVDELLQLRTILFEGSVGPLSVDLFRASATPEFGLPGASGR